MSEIMAYSGRDLLGTVQERDGKATAFLPDGSRLGTYATRRAATAALYAHARNAREEAA